MHPHHEGLSCIMSEVVSMLEGQMTVPDTIPEPSSYSDDLRFKAMRDLRRQREIRIYLSRNHSQNSTKVHNILLSHYIYPRLFWNQSRIYSCLEWWALRLVPHWAYILFILLSLYVTPCGYYWSFNYTHGYDLVYKSSRKRLKWGCMH